MQFSIGCVADYFQRWKFNGGDVMSGSDAVGGVVDGVVLPMDGSDEVKFTLSRGPFNIAVNHDSSWQVGSVFPIGDITLDSDSVIDGKISFNSSDYPSLSGSTRFGSVLWAASLGSKAIDVGCQVGPMSAIFSLPWGPLGSREEPPTSELTAVFPFEESELTMSFKSSTAGEEAVYGHYSREGLSVGVEKMLGESHWTAAAVREVSEDAEVGLAATVEGRDVLVSGQVQKTFAQLAVPFSVKAGLNSDLRFGAAASFLLGSKELGVAVDKGLDQKPTFGFTVVI